MLDEVTINGGRCKRQQARMNAMPDDQEAGEGGGGGHARHNSSHRSNY